MWKHLVEVGKQLFSLARETQQNKADVKELRDLLKEKDEEIKELRQEFRRLARRGLAVVPRSCHEPPSRSMT
jgi:chromosome segregation ATPase